MAVGLAVVEMSERVLLRYVNGRYIRDADYVPPKRERFSNHSFTTTREMPSGRLGIIAYSPYGRVDWSEQWAERRRGTLDAGIPSIARSIERIAEELVPRLREADRQAELRHQAALVEMERHRRDEGRRRVAESIRDSTTDLGRVIQQWAEAVAVENFLTEVAQRAGGLPEAESSAILERLAHARDLLGARDPLELVRRWRTPGERYVPLYRNESEGSA